MFIQGGEGGVLARDYGSYLSAVFVPWFT